MSILYDARGNENLGSLDVITGQTMTDARTIAVTMAALNAESVMDLSGHTTALFDLRTAAMNATLVFEGTVDGTNYMPLVALDQATQAYIAAVVVTTTLAKTYIVSVAGFRRVRVRVSAYTSGNIAAATRATMGEFEVLAVPYPTQLSVTNTGAVNAAVTLTLPAGGAGLFHYITKIHIGRFYSVVGVAAAAPNVITTTNIPGTLAFSVGQSASGQGTLEVQDHEFSGCPLKVTAANTGTTIVAPAQLQTIWRLTAFYYLGA